MRIPLFKMTALLALGAVAYQFAKSQPRKQRGGHGSLTTASDAIDDIELHPDAGSEEKLDAGVMETFPASDPVSVHNADETAWEKEQRRKTGAS